jgi:hypothetical protein
VQSRANEHIAASSETYYPKTSPISRLLQVRWFNIFSRECKEVKIGAAFDGPGLGNLTGSLQSSNPRTLELFLTRHLGSQNILKLLAAGSVNALHQFWLLELPARRFFLKDSD